MCSVLIVETRGRPVVSIHVQLGIALGNVSGEHQFATGYCEPITVVQGLAPSDAQTIYVGPVSTANITDVPVVVAPDDLAVKPARFFVEHNNVVTTTAANCDPGLGMQWINVAPRAVRHSQQKCCCSGCLSAHGKLRLRDD